jgi:hypothetical protein
MCAEEFGHWGDAVAGLSALLTFLAILIGGIVGLKRYRRQIKLRAAEMMLKMESEFRHVAPVCLQIELPNFYESKWDPLLKKLNTNGHLTDDEATKVLELDRCLRFFFICTVLQSLEIEQKAVIRAYYFYLNLLRHSTERHELSVYLKSSYPRLSRWLTINTPALDEYGRTGVWRPVDSC